MRFATTFSLLLATVASVPASVLALPHDFAGGVELEARTRGAEPPYYARRSLEDIKLFLRSLDDDELLAARESESVYWWRKNYGSQHGRSLGDDELEARAGPSNPPPPPKYGEHDPINGSKPAYRGKGYDPFPTTHDNWDPNSGAPRNWPHGVPARHRKAKGK
ncbi:hypothetical protein FOMPIDRAFT_1063505 [Fomitopsis schrenkii]|uniref:Uncharacterized protein n=1 Tax=Fomitopsis schrenkii TaxID=2126942 RepID=S8DLB5_FOMSC|nr:hypothetical protein FOMPIDRAFT_1063505 [Fomitopsis schrenkii]